jgi:sugar transferase (PEP-CTERM/EpsH1 system associated)
VEGKRRLYYHRPASERFATCCILNILFLTHRLPYAPNRGDRVRAFFLLRTLGRVANVDVVSLVHDEQEASHAPDLTGLARTVRVARVSRSRGLLRSGLALPTSVPITHTMLDSAAINSAIDACFEAHPPDVVLAYGSGMARFALAPPLQHTPFVLDMVDVDSAKWEALTRVTKPPMQWVYRREARVLRRFEARAARAAATSTVVTERERETLAAIAPDSRIEVIPNGVDIEGLRPPGPAAAAPGVVFCGVMNYAPNEQAALLLAREVWPLVRRIRPDATLTFVGSSPTRAVLALASPEQGVVVTGAVTDVRPYLWASAIAAAPIVTARGIQNKVLEAVAAGLPTVVTPNIMASLPATVARACVAADTAAALADAIVTLLAHTPEERRALAARADLSRLGWDEQLAPFAQLLQRAALSRRGRVS